LNLTPSAIGYPSDSWASYFTKRRRDYATTNIAAMHWQANAS